MLTYKQNITTIPVYNDGSFKLFEIKQYENKTKFPVEYIEETNQTVWYQELSISDRLKFEAEDRKKQITCKLRIPQNKNINAFNVVKLGDKYHKVFNTYHFTNKDGYKQTDLTLELYQKPKFKEDVIKNDE